MKYDPEEIDRYKKILEDWEPGAPKPESEPEIEIRPAGPWPPADAPKKKSAAAPPRPFNKGAILRLSDRSLGVYLGPGPEKKNHLVLNLLPNGAAKVRAAALEGGQAKEIGCLPPEWHEKLKREMRWERDLIVFHCYAYEDVAGIPSGQAPSAAPEPPAEEAPPPAAEAQAEVKAEPKPEPQPQTAAEPQPEPEPRPEPEPEPEEPGLRRGSLLRIQSGASGWDAIYWGKDPKGHVVVHQIRNKWSLMHLDLDRFGDNLTIQPSVDEALIEQIEQGLAGNEDSPGAGSK